MIKAYKKGDKFALSIHGQSFILNKEEIFQLDGIIGNFIMQYIREEYQFNTPTFTILEDEDDRT